MLSERKITIYQNYCFSGLLQGSWKVGHPRIRYRDSLKEILKHSCILPTQLQPASSHINRCRSITREMIKPLKDSQLQSITETCLRCHMRAETVVGILLCTIYGWPRASSFSSAAIRNYNQLQSSSPTGDNHRYKVTVQDTPGNSGR